MSTRKQPNAAEETSNTKASGKQQKTAADFDKLAQEAEKDSPRTAKPGSSGGNGSKQHNNGRGGGK
jgi:hypothetical protein